MIEKAIQKAIIFKIKERLNFNNFKEKIYKNIRLII